jgi:putative hemolysin
MAAQRLRFQVFNLELQEGLAESHALERDEDEFDAVFDHLIVIHEPTRETVGTYRLQTGESAARHLGYYSAREFDFEPFESIRRQLIELGRACVHRDHRTAQVLGLLWRGIAYYAKEHGARYLIGCSSLTSQDEDLGASMYRHLTPEHLAPSAFRTIPLPAYMCPMNGTAPSLLPPPRLLRGYLALGAKLCGPPALDRRFQTIDFLTMLDLEKLPPLAQRHFFGKD